LVSPKPTGLGADPNVPADDGDTPLIRLALRDSDNEAVRTLLANGADPNAVPKALDQFPDISPMTAPMRAARDATKNLQAILSAPTFQPKTLTVTKGNGESSDG
jgi:ankyrin repeat protein